MTNHSKPVSGRLAFVRSAGLLAGLLFGAGLVISACGEDEDDGEPTPLTTPTPPPPAPAPPPETPSGLTVSATGLNFIEWSWNAVAGATGYQVQFSTNEAFSNEDPIVDRTAAQTSHRQGNLATGANGYLRVRAVSGTGANRVFSDWSTHVTGMTGVGPAVPTNLRASKVGSDFIEWEWNAVAGATGYQVQFSPNEAFSSEDFIVDRTAEQTSYRQTNLAASANSYVRVRSFTGNGANRILSAWSTHVTGMTNPDLGVPANLRVSNAGADFIEWSWNPVAGVTGYQVQFSTIEAFRSDHPTVNLTDAQTSYRQGRLAPNVNGYLRVRAFVGSGASRFFSDWSTHVTGTTARAEGTALTNLRVTATGADFVEWSWNAVAGATGYQFQYATNATFTAGVQTFIVVGSANTTQAVRNITPGTTAYARVRTVTGSIASPLFGPWSATSTFRLPS